MFHYRALSTGSVKRSVQVSGNSPSLTLANILSFKCLNPGVTFLARVEAGFRDFLLLFKDYISLFALA